MELGVESMSPRQKPFPTTDPAAAISPLHFGLAFFGTTGLFFAHQLNHVIRRNGLLIRSLQPNTCDPWAKSCQISEVTGFFERSDY
jgi:hypothetical protein